MASVLKILYMDFADDVWRELKNRVPKTAASLPSYDPDEDIAADNIPFEYAGGNPLISCAIDDQFGAQMECVLRLSNHQLRPRKDFVGSQTLGEDPLANGQLSQFVDLLPVYTPIIIYEKDTYMTLFVGTVYKSEEKFVIHYGNVIELTCRDYLEEIASGNLDSLSNNDQEIELATTDNQTNRGRGNYPTTISRYLDLIKDIFAKVSYAGGTSVPLIAFQNHKLDKNDNTSMLSFRGEEVGEGSQKQFYSKHLGKSSPLVAIQAFANQQNFLVDDKINQGMGFFLDATRSHPLVNQTDAIYKNLLPQDFVFCRKGAYPSTEPDEYGLTAAYATQSAVDERSTGDDSLTKNMFNDFNFAGYAGAGVTHILVTHPNWVESGWEMLNAALDPGDLPDNYDAEDGLLDSLRDGDITDIKRGGTNDAVCGVRNADPEDWTKTTFAMLIVKPTSGSTIPDFTWKRKDPYASSSPSNKSATHFAHWRTFRQVSTLHTDESGLPQRVDSPTYDFGNTTANSNGKTWIGNVQYQSEEPDEDGNFFLMITNPQEDVIDSLTENDILYEKSDYHIDNIGVTSHVNSNCRFVSYPARSNKFRRNQTFDGKEAGFTSPRAIRGAVAHLFSKANNKLTHRMKKGYFRIADWPSIRLTNTAQSGTTGNFLIPDVGDTVDALDWGIRTGCSVTTVSGQYKYVGYITNVNASTNALTAKVYREDLIGEVSPTPDPRSWSVDDPYNIYIPYRTGMTMRIDNKLANVVGEHVITSISYSWNNGHVSSEITTVGINDEVRFQSKDILDTASNIDTWANVNDKPEGNDAQALSYNAYQLEGVLWWHDHEYDATPSLAASTLRDYNTFSWSGGKLTVSSSGRTYTFLAGNTDAALTADNFTSPMEATKQYVLYFDTKVMDANNRHTLRISDLDYGGFGYSQGASHVIIAYLTIGKNEDAGSKVIGIPGSSYYSTTIAFPNGMVNVIFMPTFTNVLGVDNILVESDRILQPNSLTSALLKKGAGRPWTSNMDIRGTAYNAIIWDNGTSSTDATLTFGNGDTVTIADGTSTGIGDNTTTYMYLDGTSAGLTGTLTPQFTTTHSTSTGDNKLLLALITVGVSTNGNAPTIVPFNSKQMTINANVIAADAVVAGHIQAGTIDTTKFTTSTATSISEKARNHVGSSAPGSPRTMDIWFDTSATPTVIKVWDGDSWEVRNANAPEGGGGATIFKTANVSSPPTSNAVNDLWYVTDTASIYVAVTHPANSIETSTEWVIQNVALAINSATTEIKGGLIDTQMIILQESGSSNNNIFITGGDSFSPTSNQSYIQMDHTSIKGVNRAGTTDTTQFEIKAEDGKAHFGGGKVILDSLGIRMESDNTGSNTFLRWETPGEGDAFIYRTKTDAGTYGAGTTIFNSGTGATEEALVIVAESIHGGSSTPGTRLGNNDSTSHYWNNAFINNITMGGTTSASLNRYIYFDATASGVGGTSTFGIRSNEGDMEFKNDAGSWTALGAGGGTVTSGDALFVAHYPTASTTVDSKVDGGIELLANNSIRMHGHVEIQAFDLKFKETGGGSNIISVKAPANVGTDFTLYLPTTDGSPDQVLKTDGSGNLSWVANSGSGGSGTVDSGSTGYVAYYTGSTTVDSHNTIQFIDSSNITIAGNINMGTLQLRLQTSSSTVGTGGIKLVEATGTSSVTLKAVTLSEDYDFKFPSDSGTDGQVLKTDGTGATSWVNQTTAGSLSGTNTWTAVNTFSEELKGSKSSTTAPSIYAVYAPIQTNKGMWFGDESVPSAPNSGFIRLYSESGVLKYKNSSDAITTVTGVDNLASGSYNVPTLNFLSDAGSGLSYTTSGSYKGVRISGNAGTISNFWSDGSNKAMSMYGFIDMNANNIADGGTVTCVSLTETSDSRIKTNIQDLPNVTSLAFIDSLQPRSFNRLTDTGETIDETSYGLIAQEVEEALTGLNIDKTKLALITLPETQTKMREIEDGESKIEIPNPRGLSYTQLIAPLIGAIKELKARIEVLEGN